MHIQVPDVDDVEDPEARWKLEEDHRPPIEGSPPTWVFRVRRVVD